MAQKASRKRRDKRARPPSGSMERGYARGRAKDEAARRSLKPLQPGERPTAVTVGAIAALVLALANVIATVAGVDTGGGSDEGQRVVGSLLVAGILLLVAWGMWKARYWAVLGMQTLLAITLVVSTLALIQATSLLAALILVVLIAAAGTLFWFLVKAMARIQMPERPGSSER